MVDTEYETIRTKAIEAYKKIYKDSLVFDFVKADEKTRIRLLQDPEYIRETKAAAASLYIEQIERIDRAYKNAQNAEDGKDHTQAALKAIEMKQQLLFKDIDITKDESSAMNITFVAMTKEDFENMDTIEINEGSNNGTELSANFGQEAGEMSAEERMKADLAERMKKQEQEENNGTH